MPQAFDLLFAVYPDASYPYMLNPSDMESECHVFLDAAVPEFSRLKRTLIADHLLRQTNQILRFDDLWIGRIAISAFGPEAMTRLRALERAFDATQPDRGAQRLSAS